MHEELMDLNIQNANESNYKMGRGSEQTLLHRINFKWPTGT